MSRKRCLMGFNKRLQSDCLPKTQVCANSKEEVYRLRPAQCRKVNCGGESDLSDKPPIEAPVNGSSNYNCSMVAQSLVA